MTRNGTLLRKVVAALALGGGLAAVAAADTPAPFVQIIHSERVTHNGWAQGLSGNGSYALISDQPSMSGASSLSGRWDAVDGFLSLGRPCVPEEFPDSGLWPPELYPRALSWDGSMVVGAVRIFDLNANEEFVEAIRWMFSEATCSSELLGDLEGGDHDSGAHALSSDSSILAGWGTDAEGRKAVRFDAGGPVVLGDGDLPGGAIHAEVTALSSDGSVAAGFGTTEGGRQAFRWTEATGLQALGTFEGAHPETEAFAVSGDGSVVVGAAGLTFLDARAFRWEAGDGMQPLLGPTAEDQPSRAYALSEDGSRIVGYWGGDAVVWDRSRRARRVEDLLSAEGVAIPEDWVLQSAVGVSADGGTLLGVAGTDEFGRSKAWIAYVPEPGGGVAATSALLALLGLARAGRRCR